ncbi:MAG: hypothetical protein HYR55_19570 [Acidobacteria bacterium]|nr:hypothetical protein [Acidobacteriota bacterium]MBI3656124.1 hypothetical protein [Acidobacteriota bacterium]
MFKLVAWRIRLYGTLLMTLCWQSLSFAQCQMCKTGLTNSPEGNRLVDGFRSGILLLIITPYVLVATIGVVIYFMYKKRYSPQ